jgi:hypothetical protein
MLKLKKWSEDPTWQRLESQIRWYSNKSRQNQPAAVQATQTA